MIDNAFFDELEKEKQEIVNYTQLYSGVKLENDDPLIALLLSQRKWQKEFHQKQVEFFEWKSQNVKSTINDFYNTVIPLFDKRMPELKETVKLLEDKTKFFQNELLMLQSFRNELVKLITIQTEKKIKEEITPMFIQTELKNALAEYIKESRLKIQLILSGVIILQLIILLLLGFKVL